MRIVLGDALKFFKEAEDLERYGFARDLLSTLPQLEDVKEYVFKPITIPFTPYTPVFDTTFKVEPGGVNFNISLDKDNVEVDEKIKYKLWISTDTSVFLKQIDGVFPKKGTKVVSGIRLAKNGKVKINRFLSHGQSMPIEFTVRVSSPLYSRKHPQLIYQTTKSEKFRAFSIPVSFQVYPKGVLKSGVASKINEKIGIATDIIEGLGIAIGEFPIIYYDIASYREALSEYLVDEKNTKKGRSDKFNILKLPIKQMAFVDPLGDVNILYDIDKYLYPRSIASLLNIIVHEKFGHGFFYQYTTLGKKLFELEYHRKGIALLTKELEKISNKYAFGVQWLCMSTLIPNEGFAIWLTLKTFNKLLEKISENDLPFIQQLRLEIENVKKRIFNSDDLNIAHDYFALKYGAPIVNPHLLGYRLFLQIEENFGEKCVPKALEIATDILLTRRQISLMPNTVKNDKNCADKRLEKIAQSHLEIELNNVNMFEDAVKRFFV